MNFRFAMPLLYDFYVLRLLEETRNLFYRKKSGCRDLNPGPLAPKASALPSALHPDEVRV